MHPMRSWHFCVLALAGLLMGSPVWAEVGRLELGVPAAQADLTMGCLYPMTERAAIYGRDSIAGIQVALDELQARQQAGEPVPRLRVIIDDDQSKASYGVSLAKSFITRMVCRCCAAWSRPGSRWQSANWPARKKY